MNVRLGELKVKESFSLGELKLANMTVNGGGYERGYEAGYEKGETDGYAKGEAEGIEVGRNAEWSDMWDSIQENGNRTNYRYMFYSPSWNDVTFKPKYPIRPSGNNSAAQYMFREAKIVDGAYTDLLDFSACQSLEGFSTNSTIRKFKVLDTRLVQGGYGYFQAFNDVYLEYIDEFYPTQQKYALDAAFSTCKKLYHIKFCSEIMVGGLKLVCPTLDKESLDSVMYWLSTTTEGLSVTLPLTAVNREYETSEGANDGVTSEEWTSKVNARSNWTIQYA